MNDWCHIRDEIPTAIKIHQCELCGNPILPKERYCRRVGTNGGEIYATAMHLKCEKFTHGWDADDWAFNDQLEFWNKYLNVSNPVEITV